MLKECPPTNRKVVPACLVTIYQTTYITVCSTPVNLSKEKKIKISISFPGLTKKMCNWTKVRQSEPWFYEWQLRDISCMSDSTVIRYITCWFLRLSFSILVGTRLSLKLKFWWNLTICASKTNFVQPHRIRTNNVLVRSLFYHFKFR